MGGLLSRFFALFAKKDPKKPIQGNKCLVQFKNMCIVHHKGLLGTIVPICGLSWRFEKDNHSRTVEMMWMLMFWFFLIRPINIPVTGLIPTFWLPLLGVLSSNDACSCYMSESVLLFVLGSMLILLWNNCGLDKRLALWFLCSGDTSQFTPAKLIMKGSMAAFFLGMLSNRLLSCSMITHYITKVMMDMKANAASTDSDYNQAKNIINCAISSASSIGSMAVVHASYSTLTFRGIFYFTTPQYAMSWPDMFNYLEYSSFAFPLAVVLLIFTTIYFVLLVNVALKKPFTAAGMNAVRGALLADKKALPSSFTLHEKLALFFTVASYVLFLARANKYFLGWSLFQTYKGSPLILDATVAAFFVLLLHALPNGYRFVSVLRAKKKSQLGTVKPESGILWWNFVDKNVNYGYLFLLGGGVAISMATASTGLNKIITSGVIGTTLKKQSLPKYILIITVASTFLANIMTGSAAVSILQPLVMHWDFQEKEAMAEGAEEAPEYEDLDRMYLGALAVGVASSCSFVYPFLYTPAYFCHHTGKVPKTKLIKYGIVPAIICCAIIFIAVAFYAPLLWKDIKYVLTPVTVVKPKETP